MRSRVLVAGVIILVLGLAMFWYGNKMIQDWFEFGKLTSQEEYILGQILSMGGSVLALSGLIASIYGLVAKSRAKSIVTAVSEESFRVIELKDLVKKL